MIYLRFLKVFECTLQFSSVAQSCPILCDPMNCSTPGLLVHHQLPESAQTHVHWVGDAIQPSYPLSSPFLLPSIFPSIRVFSNESALHIRWPKYWSFSFNISPWDTVKFQICRNWVTKSPPPWLLSHWWHNEFLETHTTKYLLSSLNGSKNNTSGCPWDKKIQFKWFFFSFCHSVQLEGS